MEKDLMIIPRKQYESLLKHLNITDQDEYLWKMAAKDKFFKSYSKSDEIYDQKLGAFSVIDKKQVVSIWNKLYKF